MAKTAEKLIVKVEVQIEEERLADCLCSALEGGSNYWYFIDKSNKQKDEDFHEVPFRKDGYLLIIDEEGEDDFKIKLTRSKMIKGARIMAKDFPKHFNDLVTQNDDATTGDVYLQCCCFGDVIYG